jgi:NAD(P)-dependent dehydrogenase (short-subunit alcohol dehydrogenase family)/acyl dehydratase
MKAAVEPELPSFQKRFASDDSDWFAAFSGDQNPLHRDANYALLTPWGKPVVHGMAAVLAGLSAWLQSREADRRTLAMQSAKIQFAKPICWGQALKLRASEMSTGGVALEWIRGECVYVRSEFQLSNSDATASSHSGSPFFPRATARTENEPLDFATDIRLRQFRYSMDARLLEDSRSVLGDICIAPRQLQVLAWASYFVGMEWPGASALFIDASFEFSDFSRGGSSDPLTIEVLRGQFDSRFRVWRLSGRSKDATFQIRAVDRPPAVTYSSALLRRSLPPQSEFHGKRIFVSGGSRGFGSLLRDGLAHLGAGVWYASRSRPADKESDRRYVMGDVSTVASCREISERLHRADVELDGLILNASPPIVPIEWLEERDEETLSFIAATTMMLVHPFRALLPRLRRPAFVIYISSEYVTKPVPHFAHYVAAKSAAEGLMRSLAVEFPMHSFTVVRPPKMLTNQTNTAFDYNPPRQTERVAARVLKKLGERKKILEQPGFYEINIR